MVQGDEWLGTVFVPHSSGAKITQIAGIHGGALKVRVAAAAIDGKENIALCAFIAKTLNIPVRSVQIENGKKAAVKY